MKMKVMKIKKYLQQKFSRKILVPQTTADFMSRVSKSYVPFTCKLPMIMHFVRILHRWCRSKTKFVFSYDKTSLKFCASFRFFLEVFMEKFQKNPLSELCEKGNKYYYAILLLFCGCGTFFAVLVYIIQSLFVYMYVCHGTGIHK